MAGRTFKVLRTWNTEGKDTWSENIELVMEQDSPYHVVVAKGRATFVNRSWRRYDYAQALAKALEKLKAHPDDIKHVLAEFDSVDRAMAWLRLNLRLYVPRSKGKYEHCAHVPLY